MSFAELGKAVRKQFFYKFKLFFGLFYSLVITQAIAIVFSFNGTGSISSGQIGQIHFYSADIVLVFTFGWAFISALQLTTKPFRDNEYLFVFNRLSSHLSNLLFLLALSFIGGLSAYLSGYLLKVAVYMFFDFQLIGTNDITSPAVVVAGIITILLYIWMFASLGYMVGSLVQFQKVFAILIPSIIIGCLILVALSESEAIIRIGKFYFFESSFLLVFIKTTATVCLCFLISAVSTNHLEVRK